MSAEATPWHPSPPLRRPDDRLSSSDPYHPHSPVYACEAYETRHRSTVSTATCTRAQPVARMQSYRLKNPSALVCVATAAAVLGLISTLTPTWSSSNLCLQSILHLSATLTCLVWPDPRLPHLESREQSAARPLELRSEAVCLAWPDPRLHRFESREQTRWHWICSHVLAGPLPQLASQ